MHTRGVTKKLEKDKEREENRGEEEETEAVTNMEMEQQVGNGEEARGDTIENQPTTATPNGEAKLDNIMRMMMEQFGQINENFKKQEEKFDSMKEETNDNFQKQKEELRQTINKNNETLQQQLKEDHEKNKEEMKQQIRLIFRGCREESDQTNTEMNKKWEETNYKIDLLNETLDNGFKKVNETLDSTPEGTNEKTEIKEDPSTWLSQNKSNKKKTKRNLNT